jgi:hypothetical protein
MSEEAVYGIKFKNDFILRVQQAASRLKETVRTDPDFLEGKYGYYDRIGPVAGTNKKTTRHGDTPINGTNYDRRRLIRDTRNWGDMVDRSDVARMMKNPQSRIVENARMSFNRDTDDYIIKAATGVAYTIDQDDGSSTVALPSTQKIAAGAGTGLTVAKMLAAKENLDHNEVDDDEMRYFVYMAHNMTQLLQSTPTTSQFFGDITAIKKGTLDYLCGFTFKRSERLQVDPNNAGETMCLAYAQRGIGMADQGDPFVRVTERDDKQYNWQIYLEKDLGATRIEDECVAQVNCTTS